MAGYVRLDPLVLFQEAYVDVLASPDRSPPWHPSEVPRPPMKRSAPARYRNPLGSGTCHDPSGSGSTPIAPHFQITRRISAVRAAGLPLSSILCYTRTQVLRYPVARSTKPPASRGPSATFHKKSRNEPNLSAEYPSGAAQGRRPGSGSASPRIRTPRPPEARERRRMGKAGLFCVS